MIKTVSRVAFRLAFGVLAVVMGSVIIGWVLWNELIHHFPQYTGTHWWEPFGIGPAMIATGIYWLRTLRQPSDKERTKT
jgi:hypothetical protein